MLLFTLSSPLEESYTEGSDRVLYVGLVLDRYMGNDVLMKSSFCRPVVGGG